VATRQIREICRELTFGNPKVVERVKLECEVGTIHPGVFIALLHLGYGKPKIQEDATPRLPLVFLTTHGLGKHDPLAEVKPVPISTTTDGPTSQGEQLATAPALVPQAREDSFADLVRVEPPPLPRRIDEALIAEGKL